MNKFQIHDIIDDVVFTIKLILILLIASIFGLLRRLRFNSYLSLKLSIAEYISNKTGYEFPPEWVNGLLFLLACLLIVIFFISEIFYNSGFINLFSKESYCSENSTLNKNKSKKKKKKRK